MKTKLRMKMISFILCLGFAACNGMQESNSLQSLPVYKAAADDVIVGTMDVKNKAKFISFFDRVKKREPSQVRVVYRTPEGDPILYDLYYRGEEIHLTIDTRRDSYGDRKIESTICKNIEETELDYILTSCKNYTHDLSIVPKHKKLIKITPVSNIKK